MSSLSKEIKSDPSETKQEFSNPQIMLLCCRYWILEEWECKDLSVPFWRIYYNKINGAEVRLNGKVTPLYSDHIIIIPPHTPFSSTLVNNYYKDRSHESIIGRKFAKADTLEQISISNRVDHLFIHFSLGFPLDQATKDIYPIKLNSIQQLLLDQIIRHCAEDTHFGFLECLHIKHLITSCIIELGDIWSQEAIDSRIFAAMKTIEQEYHKGIPNTGLAASANMATNSFSRLFKSETGTTVQQYITKTRIEAACSLMHHSHKSIDEIAYSCGFYDRHHFSKIFKRSMGVNPSYYMKRLIIS